MTNSDEHLLPTTPGWGSFPAEWVSGPMARRPLKGHPRSATTIRRTASRLEARMPTAEPGGVANDHHRD
jgi:hypothetical protein